MIALLAASARSIQGVETVDPYGARSALARRLEPVTRLGGV